MPPEDTADGSSCRPCTVANAAVGLLVAWLPLAGALVGGDQVVVAGAVAWGAVVTGVTTYRLVTRGYLPLAEPVAKRTGLHERIGPGADRDSDERGER